MTVSRRALLSSALSSALSPSLATAAAGTALALTAPAAAARAAGQPEPGATPRAVPGAGERIVANTLTVLAGTAESNAHPALAPKLAATESTGLARLAAMDAAGPGELFAGLPLGASDPHLVTSFQYLYEIALATRTPGPAPSALREDPAVQQRVVDGLVRLYDDYYGDQAAGYYGNWFTWEIGISTHVSRTLALLRDALAAARPELTARYVAAMDGYLRSGKDGDVDLDSRFHTGANLADITTNRLLQGAVTGDDARIAKALADQSTVCATVDPYRLRHGVTDGFYADGSFIQHASVAYTGSYGTGLLGRVVQTALLLEGTGHPQGAAMAATARTWVARGFAPLIFEGWMMEPVKGRAVSRTTTGYADATAVAEAAVALSGLPDAPATGGSDPAPDPASGADPAPEPVPDAAALAGYAKHLHETSHLPPGPAAFASPATAARYADILADPSLPARDLNPPALHTEFAAMERTVHRRPGYAFALARTSTRVSAYEYMSGENLMPWFQGQGAHYLYLAGQDQTRAYGVDHFTAVPPYALAGVTAPVETRLTVPRLYGTDWYDNPALGFTSSSESQNAYVYFPRSTAAFSGGARLDAYGAAGFVQSDDAAYAARQAGLLPDDFTAYRGADATKSWFMFDEEVAVLAAGVGDGAGRAVTTTVDTRLAAPGDAVTLKGGLRGGRPWSGPGPGTAPPAWLRYADAGQDVSVGYVFLDLPHGLAPTAALETVTRSRRLVRTANADTPVTKQVFSLAVAQPPGAAHAAMAWALLPHATEARLAAYARRGPLTVLANSTRLQAVRHGPLGIVAANAFTAGTHRAGPLVLDGPASVMVRERGDGTLRVAVADPTTARDKVTVLIRGRELRVRDADADADPDTGTGAVLRVTPVRGGTRVEAATRHTYGRSLTATLG